MLFYMIKQVKYFIQISLNEIITYYVNQFNKKAIQ